MTAKLPWEYSNGTLWSDGLEIAILRPVASGEASNLDNNAKLIVRAVNNADRLAESLRGIRNWLEAGCDPSQKSLATAMMVLNEYERSADL